MQKKDALQFFGGSCSELAKELHLTPQAVIQWPAELSKSQEDRALAAWARKHAANLPKEFKR